MRPAVERWIAEEDQIMSDDKYIFANPAVIDRDMNDIPAQNEDEDVGEWYHNKYLKSAYWVSRRERALKQDGYKCCMCGATSNLNVHHRSYERLGAESDSDLMVLCRDCHMVMHDFKAIARDTISVTDETGVDELRRAIMPMIAIYINDVMPILARIKEQRINEAAELVDQYTINAHGRRRNSLLFDLARQIPNSALRPFLWVNQITRDMIEPEGNGTINTAFVVKRVSEIAKARCETKK